MVLIGTTPKAGRGQTVVGYGLGELGALGGEDTLGEGGAGEADTAGDAAGDSATQAVLSMIPFICSAMI